MHFRIIDKQTPETKVRINKVLWRLASVDYIKYIVFMLLIGSVLMFIGAKSKYTFYTELSGSGRYYNLNILYSLGLAAIFAALIYFINMQTAKSSFSKRTERADINESWQKDPEGVIEIDEEGVKTNYKAIKQEIKWSMFTDYIIEKDILFLLISNSYIYAVPIDKKQIEPDTFEQLYALVKSKLPQKK